MDRPPRPPPPADRDAAKAESLARGAALCRLADERDRRMRRGAVVRLGGAGGDEPGAEREGRLFARRRGEQALKRRDALEELGLPLSLLG